MIKTKNFLLAVLFFIIVFTTAAEAGHGLFFVRERRLTLVGIIQSVEPNRLILVDEEDRRLKKFVYFFGRQEKLKTGDRVRIYYRLPDYFIESLKKMRPVEYKKENQNLGYILKSP